MFRGSTTQLREKPFSKQPLLLIALDDTLMIVRPPASVITVSFNELSHVKAMERLHSQVRAIIEENPNPVIPVLAQTIGDVKGTFGDPMQVETVSMSEIVSAQLAKSGLISGKIILKITGKDELVLEGGKTEVLEFADMLREPLGKRLTGSVKVRLR